MIGKWESHVHPLCISYHACLSSNDNPILFCLTVTGLPQSASTLHCCCYLTGTAQLFHHIPQCCSSFPIPTCSDAQPILSLMMIPYVNNVQFIDMATIGRFICGLCRSLLMLNFALGAQCYYGIECLLSDHCFRPYQRWRTFTRMETY